MSIHALKAAVRRRLNSATRFMPLDVVTFLSDIICNRVMETEAFQRCTSVGLYVHMSSAEVQTTALLNACFSAGKAVWIPKVIDEAVLMVADAVPDWLGVVVWQADFEVTPPTMDFLPLASMDELSSLPRNKWGIPEHVAHLDASPSTALTSNFSDQPPIDLIIVPGLGFDSSLRRIGRGKGFYGEGIVSTTLNLYNCVTTCDRHVADAFIRKLNAHHADRGFRRPVLMGVCFDAQIVDEGIPVEPHDELMDYIVTETTVYARMDDRKQVI